MKTDEPMDETTKTATATSIETETTKKEEMKGENQSILSNSNYIY